MAATREALGPTLIRLREEGLDIVVVDADLGSSTTARAFGRAYPDRFISVGIAEQNMIGVAAGLAAAGKVAVASTFAVFMPGRCFDQIRVSVAHPHLNVKLVATHGGITVGEDGISAQAIEDLALISAMPGFRVIVPADVIEAAQAIEVALREQGPFYIRCTRAKVPVIYDDSYRFQLGKANVLRPGSDATIVAIGVMVKPALDAAAALEKEGIDCRVLNMATVRPLDLDSLQVAARETGAIVTAEEHLVHCGMGAMVAQALAASRPVPMSFIGMQDCYGESGTPAQLLQKYGLTAEKIAEAVRDVLFRKERNR
jgi:transketolase